MRYDKLAETLGLNAKDVKTMVKEMAKRFEEEDSIHGIQLLLYPSTCQLCTKEQYAPYIREALGIRRGGNLSASSMEVLAVVAYNQPVTRSFVDLVRGVDSSYAVNSLLDKGLIEAAGRLDAPGRPMLYVTTDKFLRVFGINSLEELPETEALSVAAEAAQVSEEQPADDDSALEESADALVEKEYSAPVDTEETNVVYENGAQPPAKAEDISAES
jgi:segregation and condensation protein B